MTQLPQSLRYLQPFRRRFASGSSEELSEETGEVPLLALLGKRVRGKKEAEAKQILERDLVLLEQWLSEPGQQNDCLQFVRGFLMISPAELAKRLIEESGKTPKPPPQPEMNLPEGATTKLVKSRTEAALLIRWKGTLTAFDVVPEKVAESFLETEKRGDGVTQMTVSNVSFGLVAGTKFVRETDTALGSLKEVRYVLSVNGHFVYVTAGVVGKRVDWAKWDETKLEAFFHTLRVV